MNALSGAGSVSIRLTPHEIEMDRRRNVAGGVRFRRPQIQHERPRCRVVVEQSRAKSRGLSTRCAFA